MIQHDDFWDTIAKNVSVYRSDVVTMQQNGIVLKDGSEVSSDVLFCGTGWSQHYPFFSKQQVVELGLPHDPEEDTEEESRKWNPLQEAADEQVLANFPQLANPPPYLKRGTKTTPL